MASKCSKSPDGKHKWTHKMETNTITGFKTQIRICKECKRKEKLAVVNVITGARRWIPA